MKAQESSEPGKQAVQECWNCRFGSRIILVRCSKNGWSACKESGSVACLRLTLEQTIAIESRCVDCCDVCVVCTFGPAVPISLDCYIYSAQLYQLQLF